MMHVYKPPVVRSARCRAALRVGAQLLVSLMSPTEPYQLLLSLLLTTLYSTGGRVRDVAQSAAR